MIRLTAAFLAGAVAGAVVAGLGAWVWIEAEDGREGELRRPHGPDGVLAA